EQANNDSNIRSLINANLTLTLLESLTLNFDYVNGSEQKDPNNVVSPGSDSKWSGIAGIIRYVASDRYAINIRAETFSDSDGARTGVKQDMTEITVTPEFTVKKNMIIRPEFRHDVSDQKVFDKGANAASEKAQDTIAINMFFYF
ncbi:MAG: outer membrane beta-barrel protein, partial [Nitrospinota bacterium]